MNTVMRLSIVPALFFCAIVLIPQPVAAIPVDLELALLVDSSDAIDNTEFEFQRNGYAAAFDPSENPDIVAAIQAGQIGSIAVTLIYWAASGELPAVIAVPWTQISDSSSALRFAEAVERTTRSLTGLTAISSALEFATEQFVDNGFEGAREVIDISGGGVQDDPDAPNLAQTREETLAAIDTINALAVGDQTGALAAYYEANVIGGPDAFVMSVADPDQFADAIRQKIGQEITPPVPEPATIILMSAGIVGLAGLGHRRKKKK